jgi:hypothetical protein
MLVVLRLRHWLRTLCLLSFTFIAIDAGCSGGASRSPNQCMGCPELRDAATDRDAATNTEEHQDTPVPHSDDAGNRAIDAGRSSDDAGHPSPPVAVTTTLDLEDPIVAAAPDGSIYVAGLHSGATVFARGQAHEMTLNEPDQGLYVARFSAKGDLDWAKGFSNSDTNGGGVVTRLRDIAVSADGTVLVVGHFIGVTTIEGQTFQGPPTGTYSMGLAVAYDAKGELAFVQTWGGEDQNQTRIEAAAAAPQGFVIPGVFGASQLQTVASNLIVTQDDEKTILATQEVRNQEGFVAAIAAKGAVQWSIRIHGPTTDADYHAAVFIDHDAGSYGLRLATLSDTLVAVSFRAYTSLYNGATLSIGDADQPLKYQTSDQQYIAALSLADGQPSWTASYIPMIVTDMPVSELIAHHDMQAMIPSPDGGLVIMGHYQDSFDSPYPTTIDFGDAVELVTPETTIPRIAYIAKYSATGHAQWAQLASSGSDVDATINSDVETKVAAYLKSGELAIAGAFDFHTVLAPGRRDEIALDGDLLKMMLFARLNPSSGELIAVNTNASSGLESSINALVTIEDGTTWAVGGVMLPATIEPTTPIGEYLEPIDEIDFH